MPRHSIRHALLVALVPFIASTLACIVIVLPLPPAVPATAQRNSVEVSVTGTGGWQNSGVLLVAGEPVSVRYLSGQWTINVDGEYTDAGGYPGSYPNEVEGLCQQAPIPGARSGALVGRIAQGEAFLIGKGLSFTPTQSGRLYLRINDADACLNDNGGQIVVQIVRRP